MGFLYRRPLSIASITTLIFLIFASFSAATRSPTHSKLGGTTKEEGENSSIFEAVMMTRRQLGGPGSSPPSCRSKCGRCSPCYPVHIPVHPGFTLPLEYYPEAWRCKCRNKLYMP